MSPLNSKLLKKNGAQGGTSIYTYLAVIVVFVVALVVSTNATLSYLSVKEGIVSNIEKTSETVAETLGKNSAAYIESYAVNEYVSLIMHEMETHPEILSVAITDYNMGKILGEKAFVSGAARSHDWNVVGLDVDEASVHTDEHCFYSVEKEILSAAGSVIGTIRVCSSDREVKQKLSETVNDNVFYAIAISVLLFILLFALIHSVILSPVSILVSSLAENLGEQQKVPVEGAREVRILSATINQMMDALKSRESKIRSLVDNIHTGVVVHDANTEIVVINPLAKEILGLNREKGEGRTADDPIWFFVDAQMKRLPVEKYPVSLVVNSKKPARDMVVGVYRLDQENPCIWVLVNAEPVFEEGELVSVIVSFNDITPLREAERKIRTLSQSMVHAVEGIVIVDIEGVIEYVNPSFLEMTGYPEAEVLQRRYEEVLDTAGESIDLWDSISKRMPIRKDVNVVRQNEKPLPVLISSAPIYTPDGNISNYVIVHADMSEYKELENRYIQSQKMEALGTLVGGIAHDFNNMLNGILNTLYLIKLDPNYHPDLEERVDTISHISIQAANLVKGLLAFARKEQVEMAPLPVVSFLKETLKLHHMAVPENIALIPLIESGTSAVLADASRLQQVILNLLNNAVYALKEQPEPEIKVALSTFLPDVHFKRQHPECSADKMVQITISDNGAGIARDVLEHVFEPFYTTKPVGEGTGLGLSIVYGVIQAHHGVVEIESRVGEGTSVSLYLPVVGGEAISSAEPDEAKKAQNNETILLADDNELLRTSLAESLRSLGYQVIEAVDGQQAVDLFKKHRSRINILISDVVMPVMGGIEAGKAIRELSPNLPLIFITGYHTGDVDDGLFSSADVMKVGKPVNPSLLSRMVHEMLSKPKRI